jgi:aryl-alcohol dehydrogenase-like predicted oxidoreductase
VRLGVQHIDTADAYGPETCEQLIADALHPYPDELLIATKGGFTRQGPGRWRPDGRPEHLRAACEASLRRLRVEAIDVFYFHTPDPEVPYKESIGALAQLRHEGLIRSVGVSNVDEDQLLDRARGLGPEPT